MADPYRDLTRLLLGREQSQHDHLLLERFQHGPQRPAEVGGVAGQVGGTAHQQPFLGVLDERLQQHGGRAADGIAEPPGAVELRGQVRHRHRGSRQPLALQRLPEQLAQLRQLMVVDGVAEFDDALVDATGVGDDDHQEPRRGQRDHLQVPHGRGRQRRVLHDRHLPGQLGEQPHRAAQDVVEIHAGLQELQDRAPLRSGQRLDVVDPIDELAVALLGGHPARAGVRLGDVALGFQHRHVVAHRGAGDAEVVAFHQRLGTDRLLGRDEVGDDGTEHLKATVVGTSHLVHLQVVPILRSSAAQLAPTPGECHATAHRSSPGGGAAATSD